MRFPILTGVFIMIIIIAYLVRRGKDSYARDEESFWERERQANSTRKKPLTDIKYIKIPSDLISDELVAANPEIAEYAETVRDLSENKIVNLTGISNTDLKLKYGTANITELSVCDQRYTLLVSTLQKVAEILANKDETTAARRILEFAVETGTDVSSTYKLLAFIYASNNETELIRGLIPKVQQLNTPLKGSIINSLNTYLENSSLLDIEPANIKSIVK